MSDYKRLFIENAYVFLTITTYKRKPILIDNIVLLRESFKRAIEIYNFEIYAAVILPDHMHLILIPKKIEDYPKIIFAIKYHFSRNVKISENRLSFSKIRKGEKGIWQRRYWEHTIISEKNLYKHVDYIHYNPTKHGFVEKPKDWKYSSFGKFVEQNLYEETWCCEGNIDDI